jgi:DUF1680 family protein
MLLCDPRSEYADAIESAVYNGILSGVSLDGSRYFYVNPLEVRPEVARYRHDHAHVETGRIPWFGCACCPPNIARLIASFPRYFYTASESTIWVQQYGGCTAALSLGSSRVLLTQSTDYPWNGKIELAVEAAPAAEFTLSLRVPSWCPAFTCRVDGKPLPQVTVNKGYLEIPRRWSGSATVTLDLAMPVLFLQADPRVRELAGKLAIRRGPLIYCFEACDNGADLHLVTLKSEAGATAEYRQDLMGGTCVIHARGYRMAAAGPGGGPSLYRVADPGQVRKPVKLTAIPYHQWGNREANGEMAVWLRSS